MDKMSRAEATFSVVGKSFDLDKFTESVGIVPTETRTRDDWPEAIKSNPSLPEELKPRCVWDVSEVMSPCSSAERPLEKIVALFRGKEGVLKALREKHGLDMSVDVAVFGMGSCAPRMRLGPEAMSFFGALGCEVSFDPYLYREDGPIPSGAGTVSGVFLPDAARVEAALYVFGDAPCPGGIAEVLGIEPDDSWGPGGWLEHARSTPSAPCSSWRTHVWKVCEGEDASFSEKCSQGLRWTGAEFPRGGYTSEPFLDRMASRLGGREGSLRSAMGDWGLKAEVFVDVFGPEVPLPGLIVGSGALSSFGALGAHLEFAVHSYLDEEEED